MIANGNPQILPYPGHDEKLSLVSPSQTFGTCPTLSSLCLIILTCYPEIVFYPLLPINILNWCSTSQDLSCLRAVVK